MPNPKNQGDRAKAYRLRKRAKTQQLEPTDALWLDEYEQAEQRSSKNGASKHFGASRSGRRIKLDVEEHAEAVGTGNAASGAVEAAAAALASREEGRRIDHLTSIGIEALTKAVDTYASICDRLATRAEILEQTHIAMLESVRESHTSRVATELELMQLANKDGENDPATTMLMDMLRNRMRPSTPRPTPPRAANGQKKPS